MFNFKFPDFPHEKWDEDVSTFEGNEGWWSDDIHDDWRIINFDGTWWSDAPNAKYKGYGDILTDLDCGKIPVQFDDTLKGHGGFVKYGNVAYAYLFATGVFETDRKIMFIGHSLGASVAIHVALLYNHYYNSDRHIALRLFGLPAPFGTKKLCEYVLKTIPDYRSWSIGWELTDRIIHPIAFLTGMWRPKKPVKIKSTIEFTGNIFQKFGQFIKAIEYDHYPMSYVNAISNEDVFNV